MEAISRRAGPNDRSRRVSRHTPPEGKGTPQLSADVTVTLSQLPGDP